MSIMSILNDVKLALVDLDTTKFTAATGKGIKVHDGFQETFERTADEILAAVQQGLEENNAKNVLITGHSLGAAVASLDAMFLKGKLDPSIQITTTVFGLPRVGDQAWADFVDSNDSHTLVKARNSFSFITNQHDPVPRLPPLDFDYVHPSGEFHITSVDSNGQATGFVACPGQDNEKCSSGLNIFEVSIPNHLVCGLHVLPPFGKFSTQAELAALEAQELA
ncbi:hypothetical protein D9757_006630 [Collybiopsis confluens]|uniref:Fungal lipase-type domain-containing protein n=1 Tax=Collybiopsis confluens TaxID=2823264 RepID=A0A8H5MA20_9AGAR|nr:hypothetical protein D9757_006630 [Collybiopsis confluens]